MKTKLLTLVVTLTLGIILAGSLLMPVITDAQKTAGPEVSYTNTPIGPYKLAPTSETMTFDIVKTDGVWTITINDKPPITIGADGNLNLVYSDALIITQNAGGTAISIGYEDKLSTNSNEKYIEFSDGTATFKEIVGGTETTYFSGAYSWLYYVDSTGTMGNHTGTDAAYVRSANDAIMAGAYTTGDNDCYYSFFNGELTTTWEGETAINYDLVLVEGTTDLYQIKNVVITIGDETFTPYRYLVPATVVGHSASGAEYALYGAIPILVIIGLVVAATAAIVVKRND